jgi:hypothetical protein
MGWEVTVRSPRIAHRGEVYLSRDRGGNLYYGSGFTDGSSDVPAAPSGTHDLRFVAQ